MDRYTDIFKESCTEAGKSPLELRPILYWSEAEVWRYINKNKLPYPALYDDGMRRCGCMLCPLSGLKNNMYYIEKYPNLLPSFNRNVAKNVKLRPIRNNDDLRFEDDPYRYLLCWLSASFRPSKRDKLLINDFIERMNR